MSTGEPLPVLGVHGVGNHQGDLSSAEEAGARLAGWWKPALLRGLNLEAAPSRVDLCVAYYAHRLHKATTQGEDDPDDLDPEAQRWLAAWAEQLGAPEAVAEGRFGVPASAFIGWVADRFGFAHVPARAFIATFFGELHRYFTDEPRRNAVRTDLVEALERTKPRVVVAHSLGSVVAYESLWAHEHPPIALLLTVGSPLAMPDVVFDQLAPHEGPRRRPPGVARWINIADPGDCVAIPRGAISTRFGGVGADLTDVIGAFSPHKVTGYLACGATAGALATLL
jgi:hypothetical protein